MREHYKALDESTSEASFIRKKPLPLRKEEKRPSKLRAIESCHEEAKGKPLTYIRSRPRRRKQSIDAIRSVHSSPEIHVKSRTSEMRTTRQVGEPETISIDLAQTCPWAYLRREFGESKFLIHFFHF